MTYSYNFIFLWMGGAHHVVFTPGCGTPGCGTPGCGTLGAVRAETQLFREARHSLAMSMSPNLLADTPTPPPTNESPPSQSAFRVYRPRPQNMSIDHREILHRLRIALIQLNFLNSAAKPGNDTGRLPCRVDNPSIIRHLNREESCLLKMIESFIVNVDELYNTDD